jgi:3',5'-cyclic-AMP phosphodiesterase
MQFSCALAGQRGWVEARAFDSDTGANDVADLTIPEPVSNDPPQEDRVDRRGFLKCMAWAGTGVLWTASGGALSSRVFGQATTQASSGNFSFVQISDSHIGFGKDPYKSVTKTLQETVARINALPQRPDFLIHTGDLTHLSTAKEFDTCSEILKEAKVGQIFYVPGEHDVIGDSGEYLKRFGKGTQGEGWYSFNHHGVHFIGLVNVASQGTDKGLGILGSQQLEWLKADVAKLGSSTPIVVFGHVPLWAVYPQWGWGTQEGEQALGYLKRFGSVTVLNGHIHQILQKVEGNVTFHTARSTAFPQPEPGKAPAPGPLKNVPAEKLRSMLGLTNVNYAERGHSLAVVDSSLQ